MYIEVLGKISSVVSLIPPIFLFLVIIIWGLYKFWKEASLTRKENNSVFDMFLFSSFFGLLLGRVSYIISSWGTFKEYIWYWLPYERYGDQIFWFRLLPWRFFRVWDWEIQIIVMFVGFVLAATFWSFVVKKWKWSHLFTPVFSTSMLMISLSFLFTGLHVNRVEWFSQGLIMFIPIVILVYIQQIVRAKVIGKKEIRILAIVEIVFLLLPILYLGYRYVPEDISNIEKISVYFLLAWYSIASVIYWGDVNKANVTIERVSSLNTFSDYDVARKVKLPR